MVFKLCTSRVPNVHLCVMGFDALLQPSMQTVSQFLIIEHVPKQDDVPALRFGSNEVVSHTGNWLQVVKFTVQLNSQSSNCDDRIDLDPLTGKDDNEFKMFFHDKCIQEINGLVFRCKLPLSSDISL